MTDKTLFTIIVAALGYFVDVYDLVVFSVVRIESLKGLGLAGSALTDTGLMLHNTQMAGMLLGGVLWGVLGDKKGRLSILFGSILLYSLANLANAFVTTVGEYAICRFIAGVGLAGEIGAGVTLVAELLPREKRGIGTTIVAAVGVAGGFTAALVGDFFPWKTAYVVGGCMGLSLLVLRMAVAESGLFKKVEEAKDISRGDLGLLFTNKSCLARFVYCSLIGMPLWFIVGLIMALSPEIGVAIGATGKLTAGGAIMWFYGGLVVGDLGSGLFSQWLQSRRRALGIFIGGSFIGTLATLNLTGPSPELYYWFCGVTGTFAGYWAMFVTTTSESFGTNLRATVTTTVPNIVRGGSIVFTWILLQIKDAFGIIHSLEIIALGVFGLALAAVWRMRETFGIDLEYVEKKA